MKNWKSIPKVTETQEAVIGLGGARIYPMQPIGAMVIGLDLSAHEPPKQKLSKVENALDRDNFMTAEDAKNWGIIDQIVNTRKNNEN